MNPKSNKSARQHTKPSKPASFATRYRREPEPPLESEHRRAARPDTALLYSTDDIAALARVSKLLIIRLCIAGVMPKWVEIDGKRYWDRPAAVEAVALAVRAATTRDERKIA